MTSRSNGSESFPFPKLRKSRYLRPNLRQASLILPKTGERVNRRVTLREPDFLNVADNDGPSERSPMLGRCSPRTPRLNRSQTAFQVFEDFLRKIWNFAISRTGQGILKCSIVYLIGSMATFVPFIASTLGQQDGKHMVATITVYFHPARSMGSMFEAMLLAALAFIYAAIISFSSMAVSVLFGRQLHMIVLGHILVLIFFCGGGLGLVGWIKQRSGSPLVNVACSLTSLAIITVLIKEGAVQASEFSYEKVAQVLKMVLMGIVATTVVCFSIKPVSARTELRENMLQVTDSFGDMLAAITRSFLNGAEEELQQLTFIKASARYGKLLSSLTKNLQEAKYEHYVLGTEEEYRLEAKLVKCMQQLAQCIGGLRSAASTEFGLLAQENTASSATPSSQIYNRSSGSVNSFDGTHLSVPPREPHRRLSDIDEIAEEEDSTAKDDATSAEMNKPNKYIAPAEIFEKFIIHLGPSMKSLAFTLKQILDELPCGPAPEFRIAVNPQFRSSLDKATKLYCQARKEALTLVYKEKDLNTARPLSVQADYEEVAASAGHFSCSLQDFAEALKRYLDILNELKYEIDERPNGRSWAWLKLWEKLPFLKKSQPRPELDSEQNLIDRTNETNNLPDHVLTPFELKNTLTFDLDEPRQSRTYNYRLWKALSVLRQDDTKFAIKVGLGAALYALPSFINSTRPFYQHWRGEWGLLSYMLVCSMTIGASNTTGVARFLGTCLGAICAMLAWIVSRGNAIALAAMGWLMSLYTSYIIVGEGRGPMGRFIMLTYNLTALYAYSLSVKDEEDDEDEGGVNPHISEIALHRVVAVLSGCLWGLIVTRIIWPISARQKLKGGLSLLWLRMGLIWKRDPLQVLLEGETTSSYLDLREEFELNRFLSQLENLRDSAASEFELRGPFPKVAFDIILQSTRRMLEAFHAMNVVIMKDLKASRGEAEILRYTASERAQLCARISHLFQVLASSMKLEFPLNDALPSTEHARDRLLAQIFRFRRESELASETTDDDFVLLYAYALVTRQLSEEIRDVGVRLEKLFGIVDEERLKLQ